MEQTMGGAHILGVGKKKTRNLKQGETNTFMPSSTKRDIKQNQQTPVFLLSVCWFVNALKFYWGIMTGAFSPCLNEPAYPLA